MGPDGPHGHEEMYEELQDKGRTVVRDGPNEVECKMDWSRN